MNDIFKQIRAELDEYQNGEVILGSGVKYHQYEITNRISLYKNSQFASGPYDERGNRKFFYNISRFRAKTIAKMLDFDEKDLRVLTRKVHDIISQLKSYLVGKKLRNWMKENKFGVIQNEVTESLADYGTAILYKTPKNSPEVIDIKDIQAMDTTVDEIRESTHLIFMKEMTPDKIQEKSDVWNNIDEVIKSAEGSKTAIPTIKVYTRYGLVKENGEYVKKMTVVANAEDYEYTEAGEIENGTILFDEEIDEYPFRSVKINAVKGRFLGVGSYEELFDAQIRVNEIVNQKSDALRLSSKQVYTTPDELIAQNLLSDVDNGDILMTQSGLQPVQTESRALSEFSSEEARWDLIADRATFTFDAVRGETIPATTPATNAVLQNQNVMSIFEFMRENIASFFASYIEELILPEILKKNKQNEIVRFTGELDDIKKFDDMLVKLKVGEYAWNYLENTGYWLDDMDQEEIKQKLLNELKQAGVVRAVEIPKGFLKGILSDVTVELDNQRINIPLEAQNLLNLIQLVSSNPNVVTDPVIKKLLYRYSELIGVSPVELELAQENQNQAPQIPQQLPVNQLNEQINQPAKRSLVPSIPNGNLGGR